MLQKAVRILLVIPLISFLSIHQALAQPATIETVLDSHKIILGRYAELKFVVTKNTNDKLIFPSFSDTLFDGIEIAGNPTIDSLSLNDNKEKIEQKLSITAYEQGMRYIPQMPFIIKSVTGYDTIYSASSYLQVEGVKIDSAGVIRDIKDVEWVRPTFRDFFPLILVIAAVVLFIFLFRYFRKRSKKKLQIEPVKISEPPYITALKELDKLKAQKLWQQKQLKEYYSKLTAIIRTYIEQQYGIKAMEETTAEIARDIKNAGLDDKMNMSELQALLNLADLVKFARGDAQPEENVAHLESAYDFVKTSRQVLVEDAVKSATNEISNKLAYSYQISSRIKNGGKLNDLQIVNELEGGSRLVIYQYAISIIFATFRFNSRIYILKSDEKGIRQGLIYSSITMLLGWWGIPWGPVRSISALKNNFTGGKKVELEQI
jgi:hypothetical protein